MKNRTLLIVLGLLMTTGIYAQDETAQATNQATTQPVAKEFKVEKMTQIEGERVMDPQNEAHLTQETEKVVKHPQFKKFTVLNTWYKQTKTHYYFQIGWMIDGQPVLQYMKYSWANQAVTPSNQEEVEADNDY